jgi:hypothetical protein
MFCDKRAASVSWKAILRDGLKSRVFAEAYNSGRACIRDQPGHVLNIPVRGNRRSELDDRGCELFWQANTFGRAELRRHIPGPSVIVGIILPRQNPLSGQQANQHGLFLFRLKTRPVN